MFEDLGASLLRSLEFSNIAALLSGTTLGLFVGAMPGLSAPTGIALLLPLTYAMEPDTAIMLLMSVYIAAEYSNSVPAILLAIPGTPGAIATMFDGYPMAKRGEAGRALSLSLYASVVGSVLGTFVLIAFAEPGTRVALYFGPTEYVALGILGLVVIASLSVISLLKTLVAGTLGVLLATAGLSVLDGFPRYTFGMVGLREGIPLVPALIGFLALPEVFRMMTSARDPAARPVANHAGFARAGEFFRHWATILRGSIIGSAIGILPGAGASIASLIAYDQEKRWSKTPEKFGQGASEGVIAPEAANNAVPPSALIPLLTLGIPGTATAALIYGALITHGMTPGPDLFASHGDVIGSIYAGLILAALSLLVVGLLTANVAVRFVAIPRSILAPLIISLVVIGSYAANNSYFDVGLAFVCGVVGYVMQRFQFTPAATVLGFILGPLIETNFRRALLIGDGGLGLFLERPVSLFLLGVGVVSIALSIRQIRRSRTADRRNMK